MNDVIGMLFKKTVQYFIFGNLKRMEKPTFNYRFIDQICRAGWIH